MSNDANGGGAPLHDGVGRVRAAEQVEMVKRFYTSVEIVETDNGAFEVRLDGRTVKSPGRKAVRVPSKALAERMAGEWRAQKEFVRPTSMPVTRLVNTALEAGPELAPKLRDELVRYTGNDLLCYRADQPEALVVRQTEIWGRALGEMERRYDVRFEVITGILHRPQPAPTLEKMAELGGRFGPFGLIALNSIAALTGSGVLAFGLAEGLLAPDFGWTAAHVDEDFNISRWGEDHEARVRREQRRAEYDAALVMLSDVGPSD
jgi:chaperone required for assembly of F1-ATPase